MGRERRKSSAKDKRGSDEPGSWRRVIRWRDWPTVIRLGLVIGGLPLIAAALIGRDLLVVRKKLTEGTAPTVEYDATLVVGVFAAGVLLVLVGALFDRISKLTLPGGTGLEINPAWAVDARAAAEQAADADGSEQVKAETLLELRLKLEQKLTWMAKHFVGLDGQVLGPVTPGSLRYDDYLTEEQARTATRILSTPWRSRPSPIASGRFSLQMGGYSPAGSAPRRSSSRRSNICASTRNAPVAGS